MRVLRFRLDDLRCIAQAELELAPGLNWLCGDNGAGKTSVLEALSLLSTGRTFRGGSSDTVIRRGALAATVFAEVLDAEGGRISRLGFERRRRDFEARIDGERPSGVAELFARAPVLCVEPDCGLLIQGASELRRRFLDWALFHVEPAFLPAWRRFQRVLKQRNALLRARGSHAELAVWDEEFVIAGERLGALRAGHVEALRSALEQHVAWLLPNAGAMRWSYRAGWAEQRQTLAEALHEAADSDRRLGFSTVGPHRGGWSLTFGVIPQRDAYSRGQAKAAALALYLAQAETFAACRRQPPVICLDDALSELDAQRQSRLVEALQALGAQVLIASADQDAVDRLGAAHALFHVEQGQVTRRV